MADACMDQIYLIQKKSVRTAPWDIATLIMFKVIIAGGRDFNNYAGLTASMDALLKNINDEIQVVCGKARGADTLGEKYAKENGYKLIYFPADWDVQGKSAGFKRNTKMADYADALVAFWDGKSSGTKHMIDTAMKKRLDVRVIRYTMTKMGSNT